MSGWMFGYVLTTQIAFLVTTRVANAAGARVSQQAAAGAGIAAYSNAYMLFQLPYAIVGISVITALLPRMSAHAAERKYRLVSADFSTATRLASVIVVPAALVLAVLGAPLAEGVFGYGSTSIASARYVGEIFAVFSLGLLPYMLFQLLLRVFYAMHDSRTPALISVVTMVINITANLDRAGRPAAAARRRGPGRRVRRREPGRDRGRVADTQPAHRRPGRARDRLRA